MDRLLIFADDSLGFPQVLLPRIHSCIKDRKDIALVGVIDATKIDPPSKASRIVRVLSTTLLKRVFNSEYKLNFQRQSCNTLAAICSKLHVRLITPPNRDINDQEFIGYVRKTLRPTLGLVVGCLQIFKSDLIDLFEVLVNYHNGLLPGYPGLRATSWSVYFGERHTGFTYHLMNEVIDGGNVLLQGGIPIASGDMPGDLDYDKTINAAECIKEVLGKMVAREKGFPQGKKRVYFDRKKHEAITTIDDPGALSFSELQRRLFAFGKLVIQVRGARYPVTRVRACSPVAVHRSKLVFVSRDQVPVRILRFQHLPYSFYKLYRIFNKVAWMSREKSG